MIRVHNSYMSEPTITDYNRDVLVFFKSGFVGMNVYKQMQRCNEAHICDDFQRRRVIMSPIKRKPAVICQFVTTHAWSLS